MAKKKKKVQSAAKKTDSHSAKPKSNMPPLAGRVSKVSETLDMIAEALSGCAANVGVWPAIDAKLLRIIAERPDASVFWDQTRRDLNNADAPNSKWIRDLSEQIYSVVTTLQNINLGFVHALEYLAAQEESEPTPRVAKKKKKAKKSTVEASKEKKVKKSTKAPKEKKVKKVKKNKK